MNPMLKYRGGKSREIARFEQYIPHNFDTYIEPFLGGGAVYFHLEPDHAIINDINEKLVSFYLGVRNNYPRMRVQLDFIQKIYEKNQKQYREQKEKAPQKRIENKNEKLYYDIRNMYNKKIKSKYMEGVLYYFINKTAYSGMIRYNSNGEYNVPFGRYPNFNTKIITREHSELLQQADIFQLDYANIFAMA
ncbi:MAG TPA: DNA methyltransferase, partial [Clostridiales bacterium]|nr:DNA methyltransferase [Clostridiales bacterium]